ncbi:MAG TPA: glycosyltransferase [Thermomicrobiales bacterium]|nr:glycosyltransferase [Thermomicrobiales bacterium]
MNDHVLALLLFWGVWLLIPAILDGVQATAQLLVVGANTLRRRRRAAPRDAEVAWWPFLSVVVPVHNGEAGLARCLGALLAQGYPGRREAIVVDNASTDRTREIAREAADAAPFPLHVLGLAHAGKTRALNAGIALARGEIVVHIDADTALAPGALRAVARAFLDDPALAAASGAIEIRPCEPDTRPGLAALAYCEFLEYLSSFQVGRQYQALTNTLYTLSGAFSCFRRDALLATFLYDSETVSEDTKLTFDLHYGGKRRRLGFIPGARASLDPIPSLAALYAQRVRWQRGQLEVSAAHRHKLYSGLFRPGVLAPGRALLADHTLLFPRIIWTALLPVLLAFGYSFDLIAASFVVMYLFYLLGDLAAIATCYGLADPATRRRIRDGVAWLPLLPLYRYGIALCRLGGILEACAEPATWRTRDPWAQSRAHAARLLGRLRRPVAGARTTPRDDVRA